MLIVSICKLYMSAHHTWWFKLLVQQFWNRHFKKNLHYKRCSAFKYK